MCGNLDARRAACCRRRRMRGVQTNRRAALTLIELLVVMGIVAILIALILSVVARVRASAMR